MTTSFSTPAVMPADPATATGASAGPPLPAGTRTLFSTQSCVPWYPPSILAIFGRPVKARAARMAICVPSLPLLVKRICSTRPHARRASRRARLQAGVRLKRRAALELLFHGFHDDGRPMPEDQRRGTVEEIEPPMPVDVDHPATLAAGRLTGKWRK